MILATSAVLLTLLGLAIAGGFVLVRQALVDVAQLGSALQVRYAAEAGLYHGVALLAPGTNFQRLRAGTGGLLTAGPGPFTVAGGGPILFPEGPHSYLLTVEAAPAPAAGSPGEDHPEERVRLRAEAEGVRGSRRSILGLIGRSSSPYLRAPITLTANPALEISGAAPEIRWPAGEDFFAIAASSDEALRGARTTLAESGADPAIGSRALRVAPISMTEWIADTGLPPLAPTDLQTPVGSESDPDSKIVLPGEAPNLTGSGVVASTGDLTIVGPVAFEGVLVVDGTARFAGTPCGLRGAVLARRIVIDTGCTFELTSAALSVADRALRLPRQAVLLSMQDVESRS